MRDKHQITKVTINKPNIKEEENGPIILLNQYVLFLKVIEAKLNKTGIIDCEANHSI